MDDKANTDIDLLNSVPVECNALFIRLLWSVKLYAWTCNNFGIDIGEYYAHKGRGQPMYDLKCILL